MGQIMSHFAAVSKSTLVILRGETEQNSDT
jgi:hypothetical protein